MNGYEIASVIIAIGLFFYLLFRGIAVVMKAETESEEK